ncbi:MAG: MFS transporter [Myxococcaceae bacterium]
MSPTTRPLRLEEASSLAQFGGKVARLSQAAQRGLRVPAGVVLPPGFLKRLAAEDNHEAVKSLLLAVSAFERPLAVRSSGTQEDSSTASFAGQYATCLGVLTNEGLLAAIRTVVGSAHSTALDRYRQQVGAENRDVRMTVLVQPLVPARVSGVLFTRNPVTHAHERVIEASWGLGEAVVGARVTPDCYRLSPEGRVIEASRGSKEVAIRPGAEGGVTEELLPQAKRVMLCLTEAKLQELHALAARCEELFGGGLDLEWAFGESHELFLLQCRPMTASLRARAQDSLDGRTDRGSVLTRGLGEAVKDAPESTALDLRLLISLALVSTLAPLNSTMIAVALPTIGAAVLVKAATLTQWLVTPYLLVGIIAQSSGGKLGDLVGHRRALSFGRLTFAAGAVIAPWSARLESIALGRILMALGGAVLVPSAMAIVRRSVPPERCARVFGAFASIIALAAAVGPMVGGELVARFGWRSIFLVNVVPLGAAALLASGRGPSVDRVSPPVDTTEMFGTFMLGGGVTLLVLALWTTGGSRVLLVAAGLLGLFTFWRREKRARGAIVAHTLFGQRPFLAGVGLIGLQNVAFYGFLFQLPYLLENIPGATARSAGPLLMVLMAINVVGSLVSGWVCERFGTRFTVLSGSLLACAAMAALARMQAGSTSSLFWPLVLLGGGLAFSTAPAQAAALTAIPADQSGMGAGLLSTCRYVGGVIGIAILGIGLGNADSGAALAGHRLILSVFAVVLAVSALVSLALPNPRHPALRRV